MSFRPIIVGRSVASISIQFRLRLRGARGPLPYWRSRFAVGAAQRRAGHLEIVASYLLATFRRKIDVSGIEVSWLPQNKTRRGERRARVGLD
jgi:hypothetical protein